jgi:copper chaperone CopZ
VALKRVEGVESAEVSYEEGRGTVVFDPSETTPAEFIAELERMTGFTASVMAADTTAPAASPGGT